MEDLKAERTTCKGKVKIAANRLKREVERNLESTLIRDAYKALEASFSDFEDVDGEYNSRITEDPDLEENYATVNNLSLND